MISTLVSSMDVTTPTKTTGVSLKDAQGEGVCMQVQAIATSTEQHKTIAGRRSEKIRLCIGLFGCCETLTARLRFLRRKPAALVPICVDLLSGCLILSDFMSKVTVVITTYNRAHFLQ